MNKPTSQKNTGHIQHCRANALHCFKAMAVLHCYAGALVTKFKHVLLKHTGLNTLPSQKQPYLPCLRTYLALINLTKLIQALKQLKTNCIWPTFYLNSIRQNVLGLSNSLNAQIHFVFIHQSNKSKQTKLITL